MRNLPRRMVARLYTLTLHPPQTFPGPQRFPVDHTYVSVNIPGTLHVWLVNISRMYVASIVAQQIYEIVNYLSDPALVFALISAAVIHTV